MYLPVIMIERFGWPGFVAFAVPNVIGCAAFGYVVGGQSRSEAMVAQHATIMTWFSIVTVAYHMFFIVWLFAELVPVPGEAYWLPLSAAGIVLALGGVLGFLPNRDWLWLSVIVYGVSLTTLIAVGFGGLGHVEWRGELSLARLGWLTPTLCFGFLLCPYLDLTFHRAIQHASTRHAFAVFGGAFAVMLVLTCCIWFPRGRVLPSLAIAHLVTQSVFTVGAHLREIRVSPLLSHDTARRWLAMLAPLATAPLLYIARLFWGSSELGQDLYLRFLVFYGLVFPAYALVFMRPRSETRARRESIMFGAAMIASLPFYELGFLHGQTWLLVLPLGVLALWTCLRARRAGTGHGALPDNN